MLVKIVNPNLFHHIWTCLDSELWPIISVLLVFQVKLFVFLMIYDMIFH